MPTCRRLKPQNWLPWQRLLTEVYQNCLAVIFFIHGVDAVMRVAIRPPIKVGCHPKVRI